MFIATYDGYAGIGKSLNEAYEELCGLEDSAECDKENVFFFEGTEITVEFQLIKKETLTKKPLIPG